MLRIPLIMIFGCGLLASAAERFDLKVRNDFFAGFTGDNEALDRAMKMCEEALKEDAGNALRNERLHHLFCGLGAVLHGNG